jgi:cytoskeletal protein RodZ
MAEKDTDLSMAADEKVGSYLRRVREARGLNLEQLAKSIRLNKSILEAIEENRWNDFPTEAYLRSYIISMCEKLLLDKHEVIRRFSSEINSQFAIAQLTLSSEQSQDGEPSGNIAPKIIIIIILIIIAIMIVVLSGNSKKKPAPEAPAKTMEKSLDFEPSAPEKPIVKKDSVASPPAAVAATVPSKDSKRTTDTLRFECTKAPTDTTCGASVKDFDQKMNYFTKYATRYIKHNDTAQITITVPVRTKLLLNNTRINYGNFNTLYFYKGEIVRSFNRELR